MSTCEVCGETFSSPRASCRKWECSIESAKRAGGVVHTPNNLPIRCIKADGSMLEHEHGDHPDYKFPVDVVYTKDKEDVTTRDDKGNIVCVEDGETHALIYTDGCIALTMYECCYALWHLRDGSVVAGSLWKKGEWKLTDEALAKIREVAS